MGKYLETLFFLYFHSFKYTELVAVHPMDSFHSRHPNEREEIGGEWLSTVGNGDWRSTQRECRVDPEAPWIGSRQVLPF